MNKRVLPGVAAALAAVGLAAGLWVGRAGAYAHTAPDYRQVDLAGVVARAEAGRVDYPLLFAQTGLGRAAVDALLARGQGQALFDYQAQYFAPCRWRTVTGVAMVRLEVTDGGFLVAPLEKGDILLTPSSRCGGWRNGHAGLVLDPEAGLVLEAYSLGAKSRVGRLEEWRNKPALAVVRPAGLDAGQRAAMADWAAQNLEGLPYSLFAGLPVADETARVKATQCAHLVWCACAVFGQDVDGGAGWPVTPRDLALSPLLETVQVWGLPQGARWPS